MMPVMDENGSDARRLSADSTDGSEEKRLREALEARPEVVFAYLFGSAVKGARHGRSDLDVAVYLDPRSGAGNGNAAGELRMLTVLQASLEDAVPGFDIDLVALNRVPPLLADRVLRHGRLLVSRNEQQRIRWIALTKSRFCDLSPLRAQLDRALDRRIREGAFGRGTEHANG